MMLQSWNMYKLLSMTELSSDMDFQGPFKSRESWNFVIQDSSRLERIPWACSHLCLNLQNLIELGSGDYTYGQGK